MYLAKANEHHDEFKKGALWAAVTFALNVYHLWKKDNKQKTYYEESYKELNRKIETKTLVYYT